MPHTSRYITIIDAGSTKAHIAVVERAYKSVVADFRLPGINAINASESDIAQFMTALTAKLPGRSDIFHYGAGCIAGAPSERLALAYRSIDCTCEVAVNSDMLAAAAALFGHGRETAIACILGTGSNTALYDGSGLVKNVPSLGFILGDEGSGASLGRRLIQAVYRGVLPADLAEIFTQETGLTQPEVLRRVYNEPKPNKFVASLTPFLSAHIDREEIRCLVEEEFTLFFRNQLSGYSQIEQVPVGFVGSIAKVFEPQLRNVADRFKVKIHNILDVPMPGLISYHTEK